MFLPIARTGPPPSSTSIPSGTFSDFGIAPGMDARVVLFGDLLQKPWGHDSSVSPKTIWRVIINGIDRSFEKMTFSGAEAWEAARDGGDVGVYSEHNSQRRRGGGGNYGCQVRHGCGKCVISLSSARGRHVCQVRQVCVPRLSIKVDCRVRQSSFRVPSQASCS